MNKLSISPATAYSIGTFIANLETIHQVHLLYPPVKRTAEPFKSTNI